MPQKTRKSTKSQQSKLVYTSGTTATDAASASESTVGVGTDSKVHQLLSVYEPFPGQLRTFQRGMALAALTLPESERLVVLAEVLAAMDLLRRLP